MQQEMVFGPPVWCRIEEALGHYVNERNDSVYGEESPSVGRLIASH